MFVAFHTRARRKAWERSGVADDPGGRGLSADGAGWSEQPKETATTMATLEVRLFRRLMFDTL